MNELCLTLLLREVIDSLPSAERLAEPEICRLPQGWLAAQDCTIPNGTVQKVAVLFTVRPSERKLRRARPLHTGLSRPGKASAPLSTFHFVCETFILANLTPSGSRAFHLQSASFMPGELPLTAAFMTGELPHLAVLLIL